MVVFVFYNFHQLSLFQWRKGCGTPHVLIPKVVSISFIFNKKIAPELWFLPSQNSAALQISKVSSNIYYEKRVYETKIPGLLQYISLKSLSHAFLGLNKRNFTWNRCIWAVFW